MISYTLKYVKPLEWLNATLGVPARNNRIMSIQHDKFLAVMLDFPLNG